MIIHLELPRSFPLSGTLSRPSSQCIHRHGIAVPYLQVLGIGEDAETAFGPRTIPPPPGHRRSSWGFRSSEVDYLSPVRILVQAGDEDARRGQIVPGLCARLDASQARSAPIFGRGRAAHDLVDRREGQGLSS